VNRISVKVYKTENGRTVKVSEKVDGVPVAVKKPDFAKIDTGTLKLTDKKNPELKKSED
jgi:hypothetical protein